MPDRIDLPPQEKPHGDLFFGSHYFTRQVPPRNRHQATFCTGLLHPISLDAFLHPISISASAPDSDFLLSATMMMMRTRRTRYMKTRQGRKATLCGGGDYPSPLHCPLPFLYMLESLTHFRTMLPESRSRPLPAQRPNHAT